jgi:ribonuclease M5
MKKIKIKEVVVVEGKDDIAAVKSAVDCEVLDTSGLGLNNKKLNVIIEASKRKGIIILTDPDFPGEKIRKLIAEKAYNVKHAFIKKENTIKNGDLGIENACPEDIIYALKQAKPELDMEIDIYSQKDMIKYGLIGSENSSIKRKEMGDILNIGYCSGKKFLKRINSFKISRETFESAVEEMERRYKNA